MYYTALILCCLLVGLGLWLRLAVAYGHFPRWIAALVVVKIALLAAAGLLLTLVYQTF